MVIRSFASAEIPFHTGLWKLISAPMICCESDSALNGRLPDSTTNSKTPRLHISTAFP